MISVLLIAAALAAVAVHLGTAGLVLWRYLRPAGEAAGERPFVSIVRPVCGLDRYDAETLASTFALDWPDYEILFCAARAEDAAVPLVRQLIVAHPDRAARLLIGEDRISGNPKLNNVVKGWRESRGGIVAIIDSNVLLPRDYLDQVMARFDRDTGLVTSPPVGIRPDGFGGALECAFLNGMQARWQLAADQLGHGFAQGKNLVWRRDVLDRAGGPAALGRDLAEDVGSTKVVRGQGLKVRLTRRAFAQPIGDRHLRAVWDRQLRWSRVRRAGFPALFMGEILIGPWPPVLALLLAGAGGWAVPMLLLWYAAEVALCRVAGWPASARDLVAMIVRDALLAPLWVATFARRGFEWRGNAMGETEETKA
ncbi:ceramide glucosyltransferase [Paenirhodobacter populi]|uniref:Ceramide glucosyltransferase n=1 Tax=Paenirhodobacter populi TaxID=2306993 RepID=A0A443IUC7_9RHOB|nr:ceramide glucosyltransferase [Sinirhodobacter populi]RWR11698.1 ceramide glucosyltransferase [Sinirhodobacter populi]